MMQVIYNSDNYYLVEYSDQHAYELVDKRSARGMLFQGDGAAKFMNFMRIAVGEDPSIEHVDGFSRQLRRAAEPPGRPLRKSGSALRNFLGKKRFSADVRVHRGGVHC
jgi:hypothetical protein